MDNPEGAEGEREGKKRCRPAPGHGSAEGKSKVWELGKKPKPLVRGSFHTVLEANQEGERGRGVPDPPEAKLAPS